MNKKKNQVVPGIGQIAATLSLTALMIAATSWPAQAAAQATQAAAPPAPSTPNASADPVDVKVFKGVEILAAPGSSAYPMGEIMSGREGWVNVNMMIDPQGKPYEVMISGSSGNRILEKAALRAVDDMKFAPALDGTTPIDSAVSFKFKFAISNLEKMASVKFASRYRKFSKALNDGNQNAADQMLAQLEAQNLYEEAYEHYARYHYFRKWGTPEQQLAELKHAVAEEKRPEYLPKDVFSDALMAMFVIQVQQNDFGGALQTWAILEPLVPPAGQAKFVDAVNQIRTVQATTQPVPLKASIGDDANWRGELFRNQFNVDVTEGAVSEIKLRCQKKYLVFRYEPGLRYSIGRAKDACGIQVIGNPGTKFILTQ